MHPYGDIVSILSSEGFKFDFEYKINHLSFGNKDYFDYIAKNFEDLEMEHPADGVTAKSNFNQKGEPEGFKTVFYLVAVPSYFQKQFGGKYHVYQLISNYEHTYDL